MALPTMSVTFGIKEESNAEGFSYFQPKDLTLKAFANSSPGLRFGNLGNTHVDFECATLKELRRRSPIATRRNSFRVAMNL